VVVLTRYFLEDPDAAPVEAQEPEPDVLRLSGCLGQPALLVDPEPSLPIRHRSPPISADRYARYARVEFSLPRGTVPLMATPRGWIDVLPQRTAAACDTSRATSSASP
jgi:hypothetical protein